MITLRRVTLPLLLVAFAAGSAPALAGGDGLDIVVLAASGKPAAGAEAHVLYSANVHLSAGRESLVLNRERTDDQGRLRLEPPRSAVCLLVFTESEAAFVCNHPVTHKGDERLTVRLEKAVRIRGRLVDPDGKAPVGARVRAIVSGGYEMHGVDGEIRPDGTFALPPLPASLLLRGHPVLEVRADALLPATVRIGPASGSEPLLVRLERARRVTGRLVDSKGKPVSGARVVPVPDDPATPDQVLLPEGGTTSDARGRFSLGISPAEPIHVYVLPESHAARSVAVDPAGEPLDLGDLAFDSGAPIRGRLREEDGRKVTYAYASLADARGVRVRSAMIRAGGGGEFVLPHVGEGEHELIVYVHASEGVGSERTLVRKVRAGGEPLDLVVPMGLRLLLRDEAGKPVTAESASYTIDHPQWSRALEDMVRNASGLSEVRVDVRGPATYRVTVRVRGYAEARADGVEVDEDGRGVATLTLKSAPGLPPRPGRSGPAPEKPMSDALEKIEPPDRSEREDVVRYVREILATVGDRRSFSSADPEVRMLAAVGPDHVDVLLDAMAGPTGLSGRDYLLWALDDVIEERHKALVLGRLGEIRDLAKIVLDREWAAEARATLVAVLEKAVGERSLPFTPFVPPDWIRALASLRDPATYDLLERYLVVGHNPHLTHKAIVGLPGIELADAVAEGWAGTTGDRSPSRRGHFAKVAVKYGHLDALRLLVKSLSLPEGDRGKIHGALKAVRDQTDYVGPGTAEHVVRWFEKNEDRLVFDEKRRRFRVD